MSTNRFDREGIVKFFFALLAGLFLSPNLFATENERTVRLVNHQDYPIHLPVTIHKSLPPTARSIDGKPLQRDGSNLVFIANVPVHGQKGNFFRRCGIHFTQNTFRRRHGEGHRIFC